MPAPGTGEVKMKTASQVLRSEVFPEQLHEIPTRTYTGECAHGIYAGAGTDWKDVHPSVKGLCLVMGSWLIIFPSVCFFPLIVNVIFNRKKEKKIEGNSLAAPMVRALCFHWREHSLDPWPGS